MVDAEVAAARWLAGGPAPPMTADAELLALAWALKRQAYAAMYTNLVLADQGAHCIGHLASVAISRAARCEAQALADWVGGAVDALQGRAAQAVLRLDAAGAAFETLQAPAHAAASQVPKIAALSMLGRHADALACAENTLAQLVAAGDKRSAGKVEVNVGSMLALQHRHAESAAHYRRAAVLFAQVGDRQHSVMADIGLASALAWQFQFDEAQRIYRRADARVRAHGLPALHGVVNASRGLLELHRGRHAQALRWLQAALHEFEVTGPPQRLAEARMDLGAAYLALNLLPEAMALYEQAAEACRELQAPLEQAWACAQLGVALGSLGRYTEAQARLIEAHGLFQAQGRSVGMASVELRAAAMHLQAGAAEKAYASAEAAATGLAGSGMQGWWLQAQTLAGEALAALAQHDDARARLHSVLAQAQGLPELQARCHTTLGVLVQRRGDRPAARRHFEAAACAIETQQAELQSDEFRTAYGSDKQTAFDALVAMALDGPAAAEALFAAVERARARAFSLGLQALDSPAPAARESAALLATWREPLHWLQQQWHIAVTAGNRELAGTLQQRMQVLEAQALETQRRSLAAGLPAAARVVTPPALWAVQAALGRQQALVEFASAGERLLVIVVRREAVYTLELDGQGLQADVQRLRFQIDALRFGAPALQQHAEQMLARTQLRLQALHARLWAPLAAWLLGVEHVVVVPCKDLHYLPFSALHDGQQALLDHHALSLAPSAALWLASTAAPRRPLRRALALGVAGVAGVALPHVRHEAQVVAAVFAPHSQCLLDDAATLPALRDAAPGIDLLHLACHGRFRADSPYFSALALGDGGLTLRDAAALPLHGVSVTLSACETGLSKVAPGDELVGLVRGFFMAGAATVLATLWTVDDAGTAVLMAAYYTALLEGRAPAAALRQAQQVLRAQRPHPYYWAPFTLHGAA